MKLIHRGFVCDKLLHMGRGDAHCSIDVRIFSNDMTSIVSRDDEVCAGNRMAVCYKLYFSRCIK